MRRQCIIRTMGYTVHRMGMGRKMGRKDAICGIGLPVFETGIGQAVSHKDPMQFARRDSHPTGATDGKHKKGPTKTGS